MGSIATNFIGSTNSGSQWSVQTFALLDSERTGSDMVFHGISIGAGITGTGSIASVARIQSWNAQVFARNVTHTKELSINAFGKPVEATPGASSAGYNVDFSRIEVWEEEAEVAFGLTDSSEIFEDLMDQDQSFQADEVLMRGTSVYRHWRYHSCWLTSLEGSSFESDGSDARITRSGGFMFVRRERVI